jgi:predicted permease
MRAYRWLLYLYPAGFRAEYGDEMSAIFAQRLRCTSSPLDIAALWLGVVVDTLNNALRVHADISRQDLRYTARTLVRSPGYAAAVILVASLGIGATTSAFSITDHVFFRPLAFADSDRLVKIWERQPQYARMELSPANFRDWKERATSFEAMAAYTSRPANFVGKREPRRLEGAAVTADLLPMLGVRPVIGRLFTREDDRDSAPGTLLISHAIWQSEFGGLAGVLGQVVKLDDESFSIIGVLPADFTFPTRDIEMWQPTRFRPVHFQDRRNNYLEAVGKLRSGVSIDQARAELNVIAEDLERAHPKANLGARASVLFLRDEVGTQTRMLLTALFGAAMALLLIACTNLASLLLARVLGRRGELAVRTALGAGRERLVRQLLTESLLLSMLGGAIGILIAIVAVPLLARLVPLTLPIGDPTAINVRVLLFSALVTGATGVGFGVIPALRVSRLPDMQDLREGTRSAVSVRGQRLRAVLVVAQVAASIALVVSAGLLVRALWRIQGVDPGFRTADVLAVETPVPWPKYAPTAQRTAFYDRVVSQVRALPGVVNAAYISFVPMAMGGGIWPVVFEAGAGPPQDADQAYRASVRFVTPGFFSTLDVPIRIGRDVSEGDALSSPFVAVVSESFVRLYWPEVDPIGRRFTIALRERTVVGVVGNIRVRGLERPSEPQVYLPYKQVPDGWLPFYAPRELVVRSAADPATLVASIRRIVHEADPELPIAKTRTLSDVVATQTAPRVTQLWVLQSFAALSLVLAGVGLHGLIGYAVSQRSAEIGLRVALGARSVDIIQLVLRQGLMLAALGVVVGLALAYAAGVAMRTLLFGVGPGDPATFAAAAMLAAAMIVAGSLVPALRALRVDPVTVMRGQ